MAEFRRKYAAATHIYVPMIKRGVVDFAVGADWTPAAGDVKVSIDGGAAANIGTLPTAITMGNTAVWDFTLASGEVTGKKITVTIADSATKAVEDNAFDIVTFGNASAEWLFDPTDGVRAGLTSLPNAAAEAAGGLYTRGAGAGQINQNANGQVDSRWVAGNVTVATNNDKTGYSLTQTFPTNFSSLSIDVSGRTDLGKWVGNAPNALISGRVDANAQVVGDKTGYTLTSAAIQAIYDFSTTLLVTASSIGKLFVDNLNATVGSRLPTSSYVAPLDAAGTRSAVGLASANLDTQLSGLSTSISALPTANANADALLDRTSGVETGWTLRQLLRLWLAGISGPRAGFATSAPTVQNPAGTKTRLTGVGIDADGNGTWTTDVT
jgi:hypothetical protein